MVLDACVLANFGLCDLFLTLAETPRLYQPLWSREILDEVRRTRVGKLGWPEALAQSWREAVESAFPEAMVTVREVLVAACRNHEKDRHVLAAAIRGHAELIVTSNPMTPVIETFRYAFLGTGSFSWAYLGLSAAVATVILAAGILLFNHVERTFMDTV